MVVCSWLSKAQCTSAAALGTGSTAVDELQWVSFIGDRCLSQLFWAQPAQQSHAGQAVLAAGLDGHHADQARLCCQGVILASLSFAFGIGEGTGNLPSSLASNLSVLSSISKV